MPRLIGPGLLTVLTVAAVLASGSQALANHVRCGDVITQDTKLDSDVVDCPADGIVIQADDITLDLGGHTVDGDGFDDEGEADPTDYGVDNTAGHDRVVIRDGTIQDFYVGIAASSVSGNRVRRLSLPGNATSVALNGTRNRIEHNAITDSFTGIALGGDANAVSHNSLKRNSSGISVSGGQDNVIEHNSLVDGQLSPDGRSTSGITLLFADRNRVEGNYVAGVRHPTLLGVGGIRLMGSRHNMVAKNASADNAFGIILSCAGSLGSDGNVIEKNLLSRNRLDGIAISVGLGGGVCKFGPQSGFDSVSRDNVILHNELEGNLKDGVYVERRETGTLVQRNTARSNGDDGIDTDEPATTLSGNRAHEDGDLGIEAAAGVTDGGGNRAFRNGNPLQCVNVFCR